MNDFAINDTFDNFSFTLSGHLVHKKSDEFQKAIQSQLSQLQNEEQVVKHQRVSQLTSKLTVSFNDSAYLNDSFSFSAVNVNLNNILKDTTPKVNGKERNVKSTTNQLQTNISITKTPSKKENSASFSALDITVNKGTPKTPKNTPKPTNCTPKRTSKPTTLFNTNPNCVSTKNSNTLCKNTPINNSARKFSNSGSLSIPNLPIPHSDPDIFQFSQSETNKLKILGLPQQILQKYECRSVVRMFPWQLECLSCEGVLENSKNLVYSAPTSAGKTLVAEVLAIKTVLERNKKVIFILPFVSVVREKMFYFQDIFGSSGIRVEGFMGSYNPPGGFKSVNVAICTIERANSLVNRLLEDGRLEEIGTVIVDELHLLGDPHRGYLLELLLTKLRFVSLKDENVKIQIVGMSATLPNLDLLGRWLNAALYVTTFRPIPLNEQCIVSGDILNSQLAFTRRLKDIPELETDTDNVLQLCLETILNSCSVLIFCPTKNWCENLAVQIATAFFKLGSSKSPLGIDLRTQLLPEPIIECLEQLKRSPSGLDQVLQKTVSFGVAFHHAGLTMDERDIIEGAFRSGALKVLVATSTLSSGVNLPARRVIIRTPIFFGKPIDILSYKQMIGRAGRMGKDTAGESILICQKNDLKTAKQLITGQLDAISSCLEDSGRLKRALLEIIAAGVASTPEEIETFGDCTMLSQEGDIKENNPIGDALDFLIKHQFIRLQVNGEGASFYMATPLAKACLNSSMPPEEGLELLAELEKARQCFVLETELHLIYLVTPYNGQIGNIDWMQYLEFWERLPASMKRVGELVGIKLSFIINCTRGKTSNSPGKLAIHQRFYTALALQDLVNEVPLSAVAQKFNCNRGALQGLQQLAATFAGRVTSFSKQLGWSNVELLISQFQDRLQFGVNRELLDLMRLPILNGQRARVLFNAGIETLIDLAGSDLYALENILHKAKPFESKEREGESKYEADKRNQLRTIFITGKQGLTELEAAKMMIEDARTYLQYEIGLSDANWSQKEEANLENGRNEQKVGDNSKDIQNRLEDRLENVGMLEQQINSTNENVCNNISVEEDQISRKTTPVTIITDNLGNTSLNPFEISNSPTSIKIQSNSKHEDTLQLSASFSSQSYNLRSQKKKNVSCESLFNDSFDCEMKNNITRIENEEQLEKQVRIEDDSLLTKAFMNSFTESLNISKTRLENEANGKEQERKKKRTSDDIFSSSFENDDNVFLSSESEQMKKSKSDDSTESCEDISMLGISTKTAELSFEIVKVCDNPVLYEAFFHQLMKQTTIALSLACEKYEEEKQVIGLRRSVKPKEKYTWKTIKIVGIGIYWPCEGNRTTYYIELGHSLSDFDLEKLHKEIAKKTLRIFDCKEQLKLLHSCLQMEIVAVLCEDPKVADWLLDSEAYEKDLQKMVHNYAPNLKDFLDLGGTMSKNAHSLGLSTDSAVSGKVRSCLEALLNWNLIEEVTSRLIKENPQFIYSYEQEMHVIVILTKMELNGIPVDLKTLQSFADTLKSHTQSIETEAFNHAGRRFSFTSSSAVAKVLQMRTTNRRKPSTNKKTLVQYDNPLAELIIQWRKLNNTVTKMIFPLLRCIENGRIHGTCITHNSTGRVSMHEPNLQNVPRDFQFVDPINNKVHDISIRTAFNVSADSKNVLVSADYCQLELRLLAHLSQDTTLCRIMRSDCDIFKSIASKWMKIPEEDVHSTLRQQTKQISYGIIYGIGNKTLADQMNITEDEAAAFTATFHCKYPGIQKFVKQTIHKCGERGFVETLLGRRRFLPMIHSTNPNEKSKAERQAVNTTVQGSAADIAKQAMILVDKKVQDKFRNSRNIPKLVLQLHDELLYEVQQKYVDIFVRILKKCMQESVKLTVPLPVKVQTGKSWGTLIPKE